jgi:hypothetical protein
VFPTLIGKDVLEKNSTVVTDRDSQEINQLEEAATKYFPNVYRLRRSWLSCRILSPNRIWALPINPSTLVKQSIQIEHLDIDRSPPNAEAICPPLRIIDRQVPLACQCCSHLGRLGVQDVFS